MKLTECVTKSYHNFSNYARYFNDNKTEFTIIIPHTSKGYIKFIIGMGNDKLT